MNPYSTTLRNILALLCLFCAAVGAMAQQIDDQETTRTDEEITELSPFTVTADQDEGYLATSTLAGTRLNTPLRDVGASITAVTKEFMNDTNTTNLTELLAYTVNTESVGVDGNSPGSSVVEGALEEEETRRNPMSGSRSRGIASLDTSRDYFLSAIPTDSYNIDRVDIVRGPNALLFGLGSPAGVANSSLITPQLNKNAGKLQFSTDNEGSFRFSGDYNQVLVKDRLGVRLAVLEKNRRYQQKPAKEDDRRLFLALKGVPWKTDQHNLTLSASYETGEIEARRPRQQGPADRVSIWLEAGTPGRDSSVETTKGPVFPTDFLGNPNLNIDTNFYDKALPLYHNPNLFWNFVVAYEPDGQTPIAGFQSTRNASTVNVGGSVPRTTLAFYGVHYADQYSSHVSGNSSVPLRVYDWVNNLAGGTSELSQADFDGINLSAASNFFNNQFGFEVGYAHSEYDDDFHSPLGKSVNGSNSNIFQIDVNTKLLDGSDNPNFGRPFMTASTKQNQGITEHDSVRVTGYAEFDARKHFDGWLGKVLGRHRLSAVYSTQVLKAADYASELGWVGDTAAVALNDTTITNQRRKVVPIVYVGPSLFGVKPEDYSISFDPSFRLPEDGDSFPITYWDRPSQTWKTDNFATKRAYTTGSTVGKQEIDSKIVALQSNWWNDTLVTIVGWREDEATPYSSEFLPVGTTRPTLDDGSIDIGQLKYYQGTPIKDTVATYSAVLHQPKAIKLPMDLDFSVYYSKSQNFQPVAGEKNIFGDFIDPPTGDGKDYGVMISALNNRATLRLNWYETNVRNSRTSAVSQSAVNRMLNMDFQTAQFWYTALANGNGWVTQSDIDFLINSIPQGVRNLVNYSVETNPGGDLSPNYTIPTGLSDVTNIAGKGFEVEGTFNITRNWRMHFNASQTKAVQDDTAPFIKEYLEMRTAIWGDPRNGISSQISNLPRNPSNFPDKQPGDTFTDATLGEVAINQAYTTLESLRRQDGTYTNFLRKWRFNFVTNYQFNGIDLLKGVSVGGAYRWMDEAVTGFANKSVVINPGTPFESTVFVPDYDNPRISPSRDGIDLWVGYKRKILNNRVEMSLQLNVKNVFADDGLVPISYNAAGEPVTFILGPTRTWTLGSTFRF